MLVDGETVVGVQLAFYAERLIDGRPERFCNLGAWCVLPDYRFHSIRLLRAVLSQEGYHFTDLSPSGNVPAINSRLNFRSLDTTTALVPNLPWPTVPGRARISSDPEVIERTLTGRELEIYRDHRSAGAALHAVVIDGDDWCYVIYRKDRRKKLPLFVSVLHVSNPELFRRQVAAVHAPRAAPQARAGHAGRGAGGGPPSEAVRPAPVTPPQDVPERRPAAGADRLPVQRARVRPVVKTPTQLHQPRGAHGRGAERGGRVDLQGHDRDLRRALGTGRPLRRGAGQDRARTRRARRDLPGQEHRDGRRDLRHPGGGRRVRARQPSASGAAGGVHPRRLRRPRPRHVAGALPADARGAGRARLGGARRAGGRRRRTGRTARASLGRLPAGRGPPRCPGCRRRHGRDLLHVREHRQAEGRGPFSPEPDRRRLCRQPIPRERRGRLHPRRAPAQLRRGLQPAHHRHSRWAPTWC